MNFYDICDLNNWIISSCGKFTFSCWALNIKTQNSKWRNFWIHTFTRQTLDVVIVENIKFDLTHRLLFVTWTNLPISLLYSNPSHATNFIVYHKTECIGHTWLICYVTDAVFSIKVNTFFNGSFKWAYQIWVLNIKLQKWTFVLLIVHDWRLVDNVNLNNRILLFKSAA